MTGYMDLRRRTKLSQSPFLNSRDFPNLKTCHSNQQALVTLGTILIKQTGNHHYDIKS